MYFLWNCEVYSSGLDIEHSRLDGAAVGHVDKEEEFGVLEDMYRE